jgi:hypothetical protein
MMRGHSFVAGDSATQRAQRLVRHDQREPLVVQPADAFGEQVVMLGTSGKMALGERDGACRAKPPRVARGAVRISDVLRSHWALKSKGAV